MKKQGKKRLTIEHRMTIQACIHDNRNLAQISARINFSKSTISREISKFSYTKPGNKHSCAQRNRLNLCNGCKYTGVCPKIKKLFAKIGKDKVKRIFPINLADNGVEFTYFNEIEIFDDGEKICDTFFTNPYKSTDKAECERNHEFIRYMIPKGKSLDFLTQEKVNDMFSNINSYIRKSKKDSTPYDLVLRKFGKEFLDAIGIKRIPKKKVKLAQIA